MDFVLKPFIHLLPLSVYNKILFIFGENDSCIKELLNIKAAGLSIEHFESIIKESNGRIVDRILWFINPHYKQKFKLKPCKLIPILKFYSIYSKLFFYFLFLHN